MNQENLSEIKPAAHFCPGRTVDAGSFSFLSNKNNNSKFHASAKSAMLPVAKCYH